MVLMAKTALSLERPAPEGCMVSFVRNAPLEHLRMPLDLIELCVPSARLMSFRTEAFMLVFEVVLLKGLVPTNAFPTDITCRNVIQL